MLVHCRGTPSLKFAGTHLYTWVERSTVKVKRVAQERNAMSPTRTRNRTTRSGVERSNHEATVPPTTVRERCKKYRYTYICSVFLARKLTICSFQLNELMIMWINDVLAKQGVERNVHNWKYLSGKYACLCLFVHGVSRRLIFIQLDQHIYSVTVFQFSYNITR